MDSTAVTKVKIINGPSKLDLFLALGLSSNDRIVNFKIDDFPEKSYMFECRIISLTRVSDEDESWYFLCHPIHHPSYECWIGGYSSKKRKGRLQMASDSEKRSLRDMFGYDILS